MSARVRHPGLAALLLAVAAVPLGAQRSAADGARDAAHDTVHASARDAAAAPGRLTVSLHYATLRPSRGGELFALLDRALAPGGGALRPRLVGGEVRVDVARRWRVLAGVEGGGRTVGSVSRATPSAGPAVVAQQTTLSLTGVQYAGAEWEAVRWRRRAAARAEDRARLVLGGGVGRAGYALRQLGGFVDADRRIAFGGDLRSAGHGALRYLSAAAEVPVGAGVAVAGTVRRQAGRAPMSADYATFDRLDLGGTAVGVGLRVRAGGRWR